jgi:hypothetical protein
MPKPSPTPTLRQHLNSLLLLAILMTGPAIARADSSLQLSSDKNPAAVADCLKQGIHQLKIPDDYVQRESKADGMETIKLLNPVSGNTSLQVDVQPDGEHSRLQVDQNGIPLTPPWLRLIKRCAS